jgi:hypothetical protein
MEMLLLKVATQQYKEGKKPTLAQKMLLYSPLLKNIIVQAMAMLKYSNS